MQLVTIQTPYGLRVGAQEKEGFLDLQAAEALKIKQADGVSIDVAIKRASATLPEEMMQFLAAAPASLGAARKALEFGKSLDKKRPPWYAKEGTELGPVVPRPPNIYILRGNYRSHRLEVAKWMKINTDKPERPFYYTKPPSAVIGSGQSLIFPRTSKQVNHEVELAVVIGKGGRHIKPKDVNRCLAGYTIALDMSARDHVGPGDGDARWKSFDTFFPIGPCLVPPEDMGDVNNLRLRLWLNGKLKQDGSTEELDFKVPDLVSFISEAITLQPGDMISTGTPAGAGPVAPGDVIEAEIEGIGKLRCPVVAEA